LDQPRQRLLEQPGSDVGNKASPGFDGFFLGNLGLIPAKPYHVAFDLATQAGYFCTTRISGDAQMAATKRAPGGGRKPLPRDRAQSAKLMVRLKPDLLRALDNLARRNDRSLSAEIRDALYYWLYRSGRPHLHIGSLTALIEVLVNQIEEFTDKRWLDDPLTGAAVRKQVGDLIQHFAPKPNEPMKIPPALGRIVDGVIALAERMRRDLKQRKEKE